MGERSGPKSPSGGDRHRDRFAESEQYGRGERDPLTGLYEWYEFPPDFLEEDQAQGISVLTLCEQWPLVVADFASEYGIRLATGEFVAWREFEALLTGLLAADTRLYRHFTSPTEEASDPQE